MFPGVLISSCLLLLCTTACGQSHGSLRFEHQVYNVTIPENSVGKTYATQSPGEDTMGLRLPPDSDLEVRYKISGGDRDEFFKAEDLLVGDFCFLFIRTRTGNSVVLNRERRDKYVLDVHATASKRDGKSEIKLKTSTTVIVRISDTNDLTPLFYPTDYYVEVPEDTPLHKSIVKVSADDADLGLNGEVYYSFTDSTDQFAVNPSSGVVTITRPLVFSERSRHVLSMSVEDRGALVRSSGSASSKARLIVKVKQVNLFAPEINVQHLPDIFENSNAEIYAIVRVIDKDEGVHGQIRPLEIVDGDPDGHFRIQPGEQYGEFNIVVHSLLDREKTPQGYNLTLKATDYGVPPRQSYKSVPVHLADVNDNAPVFHREMYEVNIPETAPINTPVIRLKVTDKDVGKNAQVFLEIVGGNEGNEFYVNPDTGMLYTAVSLDAESKAFYTLTVSAIDQGNTGTRKQSSAKVKIYVLDTNDNDPLFEKPEMYVSLMENQPAGTTVIKVTARDKDSGENAYISYSIANLNPVPFEIDHFSGVIKTTQVIDYESMKRHYVLRIRASDWGLPYRRQTEMQLTINITDVNDNRPQFERIDCTGNVPRYLPIGSEIITLSAIDFDAGNPISYRIVSGNEDKCFSLESTSGILSVSCDLQDIRVDEREINVTAMDEKHYSDIVKVHFYLVNAKKTLSSTGRLLTNEIGSFECKDTGVARRLTEVLAAAERNNMPGRDTSQEEFAMMPSRYGENVHTPEFLDFPLEVKVNESVPLGTTLTKIKARDRDLGYNGKLIFGISSGDPDSVFRIDPETGDLKIIGYLDRERESEYNLNVTVYDLGKPQKSVSRYLPITVLDVNDNAPKFEKTLASFRVTENAMNGTAIFKVNATDADSGEFSKIKYILVTDTRDFYVDPVSGVLSVSAPLDRERQSLYELKIRAKDNGGLYSDALVRVTIDDVNDNAPHFSLPTFNVKVREDVPKGTVVAIVNAVDPDLGSGGEIQYSIIDEGDLDGSFTIDSLSGTIRTAKLLNFEDRQMHSLTIRGTDKGRIPLNSETTVIIEIVDVNENLHTPVFSDLVLQGSVRENKPVGTEVLVVKATDDDPPGLDSKISYSIRGGDGLGYFAIDNKGQLRTLAVLDTETKDHYWLTVCAQDQGVAPLHSCVKVYIVVEDENDCVPLTIESSYTGHVPENSHGGITVVQVKAEDADRSRTSLTYKIASGNPGGLFQINPKTGVISTTERRLDRETQAQHWLEVQVSDSGDPPLSSTTRVLIQVTDVNDHSPVFLEQYYSVKVPAAKRHDPHFQNNPADDQVQEFEGSGDNTNEDTEPWETYSGDPKGVAIFRVLAYDEDEGENGDITYNIKSRKGKAKFHVHPKTGVVVSNHDLEPGSVHELNIRAIDNGSSPKSQSIRVTLEIVSVPEDSPHPPVVKSSSQTIKVTESDNVGFLVSLIQASDEDNDTLWYDIIDGNENNDFFIGSEKGNVHLAKKLMWERKSSYALNISVTDGVHKIYTQLNIIVINDVNEQGPIFSQNSYLVNVSETFSSKEPILRLRATGHDNLLYSILNARSLTSLSLFKVDSLTGDLTIKEPLDRETIEEHLLTVMVRDQALKSKRSYARVIIRVFDHNDHPPEFSDKLVQGKVYETSPAGTSVVKVLASDKDKGENAVINYSIASGNIGNMFSIDSEIGDIILQREFDINSQSEYTLQIKALNPGPHPLSSTIPAHIMVTMADNASPRFLKHEYITEVYENETPGTFVENLEARSTSSLLFQIVDGNINDVFDINPSTGIISTKFPLDFEKIQIYNLTISATNMAAATSQCSVIVHVLDRNDNAPRFLQNTYYGSLPESAPIFSHVVSNNSSLLVISTEDLDSDINSLRSFEIVEPLARLYFSIESTTGAVKIIKELDHETIPFFIFHVTVTDMGKPRLSSDTVAKVNISVLDINDCPPRFEHSDYNVTLLLPTYKNVAVISVHATDPDTMQNDTLKYSIIDGDVEKIFSIDPLSGVIIILYPERLKPFHKLHIRVSDGKFSSVCRVHIKVNKSERSGLIFQKSQYEGSVVENSTKVVTVAVVNVIGNTLNEHVEFRILNPTDLFTIGLTSGAIQTTGKKFDREAKETYLLIVEAKSSGGSYDKEYESPRIAHVKVNVTILDINDFCPMFVNLPYYAVVSVDDPKGQVITKVHAIDMDSMENGEVRYEMKKGQGELFKVCRKTGEISLKQNLEGHNKEYQLIIGAYDGGTTPCHSEAKVNVKVVDKSMPVFDKQFYSMSVPENIELQSPLGVPMQASSPLGRKLIYTIVEGNDFEEFQLDFNTAPDSYNGPCMLFAAEELDYEQQKFHQLMIRATDSVTGVYAEVEVSISVDDVNDCPPEFSSDSYHVPISEAAPSSTLLMKLDARDNDTGINQEILYSISPNSSNASLYFHVDASDGNIYLKQSLDRETVSTHHFTVIATDKGVPALSSTAHVWVTVLDMNDNPPRIEEPVYNCVISEHAVRGQFVTRIAASDPDISDQDHLSYSIISGNDQQTFSINSSNGVISLMNIQKFGSSPSTVLNVSVSDGVYTTFSLVKVTLSPANRHSPKFTHVVQEAIVMENQPPDLLVTVVNATDDDFGEYGTVSYSIPSNLLKKTFSINSLTGELRTLAKLDRETTKEYVVPIMASDGGGRPAFMTVRVKVADVNDNEPVFLLKEYKAAIFPNQSTSISFLKVRAIDLDDGSNAKVQYSIYEKDRSVVKTFGVNPNTGAISLVSDIKSLDTQVFQFWVRATDLGKPALHSDVSVEVYIMTPEDRVPIFEKNSERYFLSENSPTDTEIAKIKTVSDVPCTFRILPGLFDPSLFHIDSSGRLTLSNSLDKEKKDSYLIGILAETQGSPSISTLTEVTLSILDENDNSPEFHSNPYIVTLAENIEQGTYILKVTANDKDSGSNGEVRYSLGSDMEDMGNVFAIDQFTGWITTLVELDRETQSEYKFQVLATDNGNHKHVTKTTVIVRLKDYNDCPPVFTKNQYNATINEDALPGTVVLKVAITDEDSDETPVEYYVISGDPLCQFQIRPTGEVFITKLLDRETISQYNLDIITTDGRHSAKTKLIVDILDANDNPPYCLRHRYRKTVSEGAQIGSYVLNIEASDEDLEQNAKLRYYLSGENAEHFMIDRQSGEMKTAVALDRETFWKYQLIAHVQDKEKTYWECSSEVEIIISDINDNSPQFLMGQYSVTLPEDVEVGTLVTKVHAYDKDLGMNRKVRYSLVDNLKDQFDITPDSGIVTLRVPLDRETRSSYTLEVRATDLGSSSHWSQATIQLTVSDINDNPPEFATKYYSAAIPEIDSVGTEVVRVLATSRDTGVNAEITYSIIGGNEHNKFSIHPKTGVISIFEALDYERAKEYFLTVQAKDGGDPPLSNQANVNISVIDSNDNAPIFTQVSYNTLINENAQVNHKFFQVVANDIDSGNNGKVTYSIERGDLGHFIIDPDTGYISVASQLDRETQSSYVLEIHARDNGLPVLSSFVMVNIEISDANDNPPLFSQSNYTAMVQEDKPLGHMILKFVVHDADAHPNAAPYTFDFRGGNEANAFRLEQDGFLRTATRFNHKFKDHYVLEVRVFDNGNPPLFSDTWVIVKIIEESHYEPILTPLEININSFMDEYVGGEIGKVFASDQDPYDVLTYGIAPMSSTRYSTPDLFRINETDGTLYALPRLDIGDYQINVTVSDGKFSSFTVVKVNVELISEEMLKSAVVIRFREIGPKNFVLSHRKGFIRAVHNIMNCRLRDVVLISVQPSSDDVNLVNHKDRRSINTLSNITTWNPHFVNKRQIIAHDLDVLFAVKKPSSQHILDYYPSESIRKSLNANLQELEESTKLVVEEIVRIKCSPHFCAYGECQDRYMLDVNKLIPISTDITSFVSPVHYHKIECKCQDGYGGDRCETIINECAKNPCPSNKKCFPDQTLQGYSCQCVEGSTDTKCDIDLANCHGESCYTPNNPVYFGGKSYAQYKIRKDTTNGKRLLEDHLTISMKFRTLNPSGNLMFASGKIDYNILEVVDGKVRYRFELGSGEGIVSVPTIRVSDGRWHEIRLDRDGSTAHLTVDGKHVAHGSAPGTNGILNLYSDDLFLGAEVRQHSAILGLEEVHRGFVGCIGDIRISHEIVPTHNGGSSGAVSVKRLTNVEIKCPSMLNLPGPCGSLPCQNGGTCKDLMNTLEEGEGIDYECQCHERFTGQHCDLDTDPCASQPCLYGGSCKPLPEGDFECLCIPPLRGKRCEIGRWCGKSVCLHGGHCEEGDGGPACRCPGYYGPLCEIDIDECKGDPCLNGATCINEPGSFRCVCPPDKTGMHCGNPLHSDAITSGVGFLSGTNNWFIIIITVVIGIFLLISLYCVLTFSRRCRNRPQNNPKETITLNSNIHQHLEMQNIKRGSKLSNLEIQRTGGLLTNVGLERPASYAPISATHTDPLHSPHQINLLNNLDTLRSYGSAGDDLENIPADYRRNLNIDPVQNNAVTSSSIDADPLHKTSWSEQMHLQSFQDNRIKNDLKGNISANKSDMNSQRGVLQGKLIQDPRMLGGYHWDCSDWCNGGGAVLSNISEVPGSEVPDSSSFHSNESNESRPERVVLPPPPLVNNQNRQPDEMTPLNEEESSYAADEDEGDNTDSVYNFNAAEAYLRHPNSYLPTYIHSSTEGETGAEQDLDGDGDIQVPQYGFQFSRRRQNCKDTDMNSTLAMLEERNSLLSQGSQSDISTMNVCEIEDSDCDIDTSRPKSKWTSSNGVQHTSV